MSNLGLLVTQGVCPEVMVKLSGLAELPVVGLTGADYIAKFYVKIPFLLKFELASTLFIFSTYLAFN